MFTKLRVKCNLFVSSPQTLVWHKKLFVKGNVWSTALSSSSRVLAVTRHVASCFHVSHCISDSSPEIIGKKSSKFLQQWRFSINFNVPPHEKTLKSAIKIYSSAFSINRIPIKDGMADDYSIAMQANDQDCVSVYSKKCPMSILAFLLRSKFWQRLKQGHVETKMRPKAADDVTTIFFYALLHKIWFCLCLPTS